MLKNIATVVIVSTAFIAGCGQKSNSLVGSWEKKDDRQTVLKFTESEQEIIREGKSFMKIPITVSGDKITATSPYGSETSTFKISGDELTIATERGDVTVFIRK